MAQTRFSGPVKSDAGFIFGLDPGTTTLEPGTMAWSGQDGTVDVGLPNGVTMQLGQEMYYLARNQTGSTIPNGTVVQFAGSIGNSGRLKMTPALAAANTPPIYVMGVTTQDVPTGTDGYVTAFGAVRDIDTRGGAENWVDGDILYVSGSVAGKMTKVAPTTPVPKIVIAAVTNAATNGNVFVRPTFGDNLANLHDVRITTPTDGQVLKYNATGGYWYNANP